MPGIFDDEWTDHGQIWANPFGTKHISLLDVVAKYLKWSTLRRISRLARNEMCYAGA
jgi:hypothetical protein